jgi:syntaxin 6
VESVGDRWGIPDSEKRARRQFVDKVKREVDALRARIPRSAAAKGGGAGRYTDNPDAAERGAGDAEEDSEEARRWEREEQQMLVRRQDDTLGYISGTLHNLASQAGLIGTEVAVQGE